MEERGGTSGAGTWILLLVILGPAVYMLSPTGADPDLWGHVRFGQLMLSLGHVTRAEPFSYLTDAWINHEWLAEITFALVFDAFGAPGLVALKVGLGLSLVGGIYAFLLRRRVHPLIGVAVSLGTVLFLMVGLSVRPHLFTFAGFLALLLILDAAERGRRRWLLAIPPLFVLWANLHGGFLAGLGVMALWCGWHGLRGIGGDPAGDRRRRAIAAGLAGAAALAATLVTPYGPGLLLFVLRTATVPRPDIVEWQPIEITSPEGLSYVALLALSAWALLRSDRPLRPAPGVILGVVALLPMTAVRHLPLFGLAAAVIVGPHLGAALPFPGRGRGKVDGGKGTPEAGRGELAVAVTLAAGITAVSVYASLPHFRCIGVGPPLDPYPARAVALLGASGEEANLAVDFDWGQYAIWHLGPRIQVGMDGRRETVYPRDIYGQYLRFARGSGDWETFIEGHATDLILVKRGSPPDNLLTLAPGWGAVHRDSAASVYARAGTALADRIGALSPPAGVPADGEGLCFP